MGKKTILLVNTRKMFCNNPQCSKKTFSEQHSFVARGTRKTERLEKNIIYTEKNVSSTNVSKLLAMENITISKSSICELIEEMPSIVNKSSICRICVDDFAIRKRYSYGTVMVDLDTHRVIDIIPSREVADVKEWLSQYPNIEIVSRDGAQIYNSATLQSHPNAIQISDRFHMIKGLSETVDKYIMRAMPARVEILATYTSDGNELRVLKNGGNYNKRVRFAHDYKAKGYTVSEIAYLLGTTTKTIQKYLMKNLDDLKELKTTVEKKHAAYIEQKKKDVEEARRMARSGIPIETIA